MPTLHEIVEETTNTASLVWVTPEADKHIAYLARVSNNKATPEDPAEKLIAYLIRNKHWSPFEMASMCVKIETTRDISAQILRHRSFSFQEFSTRYAEVEDLVFAKECRFQGATNRQSSLTTQEIRALREDATPDAEINGHPLDETVAYFDAVIHETRVRSMEAYRELLDRGVAKEVARAVLPIGLMPTKLYMTGTIRSWLHYVELRATSHTQAEHRVIAEAVLCLLREHLPSTFKAWEQSQ
jgi:thymidylate synthase (FAD)